MKRSLLIALSAAALTVGAIGAAQGDDDDDEREGFGNRGPGAVENPTYRTECGGCHVAYPPELLPANAWRQLMGALDRHFGDDATLEAAAKAQLLDYLVANAGYGEASVGGRLAGTQTAAAGEDLPRITQTAMFRRQHEEIPMRLVKDNPQVKSFANCQLCHRGAEQGSFDEDQVAIPGATGWDKR